MSDIKLTMKKGLGAGAGSTSNVTFNKKSSTEKQTALIYDMLSEGPVEGLVDGAASVYLDGTPVMEPSNNKTFGPTSSTNVTYTASTGVIVDNNGSLFSGKSTSEGSQYIRIHKAGKSASMSITAGTTLLTSSTNIFNSLDVFNSSGRKSVHIPGAGVGGSDLIASIGAYVDQKTVYIMTPASTTVSNVTVHVDLIALIGSIQSSSQATLASSQGLDASNVSAFVTTPAQTTASIPKYNFDNTAVAFRPGTRDQSYLKPPVGLGSSSIVYNASTEIAQTDLSSLTGISSTPNDDAGWSDTPEPTASRTANLVTAQTMGVTDPGEVDQISISINFPSGIFSHKAKSGKEGATNAEFLIDFEYTTDGTNYSSERIFGASDAELSARGTKLNKPNTNNSGSGTVRRLTRTPFNYSFSFDIEKFQPFTDYRVNIQKVTPAQAEHGDFVHTAPSQLQAISNIIEDKLSYPYTAYGAVIVDAQNFSSIPNRGYDLRGLKIKVPTNYIPRYENSPATYNRNVTTGATESSDQDWDGNFRGDLNTFTTGPNTELVWTDNPVWILLDIMTNDRYGLGKYIDPNDDFAQIDKFQLYQISKYCDELVPDGKGGFEPRFTCNMYITELAEAQRYLSDIISIFRGMLVYFNGKVSPQLNAKKSPVYTFSKANVINGAFSYQSSSNRFRSNQIRVTYNNPDAYYRQEVEVVEDTENILETNRINPTEVTALGCTSQGQAIRHGKWILLTERFAEEVVTFGTGLNAAHLKPGDLIEVQDSDIYTTQSSGRVTSSSSSTTTIIKLDRAVDLSASGTNFDLNLIYPTGGAYLNQDSATISSTEYKRGDLLTSITSEQAAINTEDDDGKNVQILWSEYSRIESKPISSYNTNTITVSSAFSSAPNSEVMWSITATAQATGDPVASAPKPFLITSIQEDSVEKTYSITAVGHSEELYDLVDRGYIIEESPEIRKPPTKEGIIPEPTNMGLTAVPSGQESAAESIDINSTGVDLLIGWTPPLSTDANSNKKYEFIAGYEIMILGLEDDEGRGTRKTINLGPDSTGHRIKDVSPGVLYTVFLRVLTTNGLYSKYIKNEIEVVASKLSLYPGPKIEQIMKGGILNQALTISASTVSVGNYGYQFDAPDGITYLNNTNTSSCYQQNFNGMSANSLAYLLFDASESTDKFKAVQFVENTTAVSANGDKLAIKYWKEVGASNEGLTTISGTASMAVSSNLITGSGTSFTTEFEVGDKVFLGSGTSLFMGTINAITSNTSMRVSTSTTRVYSGVAVKKQSFIPANDVILAKIVTDASSNYTISETYAITAGLDGAAGGGVDARTVKLAASSFVLRYDNGALPDDSTTIQISATPQGHAVTPTFDYYKSTDQGQNWSQITTDASGNTIASSATSFTLADSDEPALDSETQIRCRMFEGGVLKATDVITLFAIQDGAGGIGGVTGNLTNSTHTVATNSSGSTNTSGFYDNAGGSFEAFVGSTFVSSNSNVLFYVGASGTSTTATQNGLTFTLTQSSGAYALTGSSWTSDVETFTVRALIPASVHGGTGTKTLTRKYTLSKSKAGTSVTVGTPSTDGSGNTTVPITDGDGTTTLTIAKGTDGQTQGVKVAYASDANGSNKSFTQGNLTFVKYVEYTGTAPGISDSVFNSGYVEFIGEDGQTKGVIPIYATDSSGSGASFTKGTKTFVNFYEYTGTTPSSVPSGLTYVKFIGDDGNSVTIGTPGTDSSGNTTVPITDENGTTTLTIAKGDQGTTQGVKVAYASDANGSNKSFTQGSLTFVKYVEYTGTAPAISNSVFNSGYVKFIGTDGTSEGVVPIYANNSSGSGASFTQGSRTFVNFYEWTGSEPTSVPSGLTYVKFIGDQGDPGLRTIQGYLYQEKTTSGAPSAPSGNTYTFSSGAVTGTGISTATNQPNNVWLNSPNTQDATSSNTFYTVRYYGTEASANSSTISVAYAAVTEHISFNGVVTFTNSNTQLTDGGTPVDIFDGDYNNLANKPTDLSDFTNSDGFVVPTGVAAAVNNNTTTINGAKITTGTVNANVLSANTTLTNRLYVGSILEVNTSGKIYSTGKTDYADADAGFFLGYSSGAYKFDIGSSSKHLRWDGSNLVIKGTLTGSTGTFGDATLSTTGLTISGTTSSINLGSGNFIATGAGAVTAKDLTLTGSVSGGLSSGSGTSLVQISTGTTIFKAGADADSPIEVVKTGTDSVVKLNNVEIYNASGSQVFSSSDGFSDEFFSSIAQTTGTAVSTISKTVTNSSATTDAQKVVLTGTQTLTISVSKPATMSGYAYGSDVTSSTAVNKIPSNVRMRLMVSTNSNLSGATELASLGPSFADGVDRTTGSGSGTEYNVETDAEIEPGFRFFEAHVFQANNTNLLSGGKFVISDTDSYTAGTYYFFAEINGTAGTQNSGINSVSNTAASRTLSITAAAGESFYIDESGDGSEASGGDITAVIAGNGMTGGANSGSATLTVGAGTGITVNANDIQIADNGVGSTQLNVTGNGNSSQFLRSDGDGTFTWATPANTTYTTATSSTLGLIKIGYAETGKNYPVELSAGKAYVNVPWTDNNTTYSTATSSVLGIVKIGYTENGNNYPVELSNGQMYVNVPWVNTNYFLNGISKSGNTLTFSVSGATNQSYTFGSNAFNSTTIPTNNNQLANGENYITATNSAITNKLPLAGGTMTGNLLVGVVSSSGNQDFKLQRNQSSSHQLTLSTSGITATGNVTAFSDKRLKTNIQTLDSKKALQMRGVSFIKDGVEGSGVIAQEIEKIAPELVLTADDEIGTKSVAYGNLVGYLIETVKELKSEIDELKERLDNDISK